MTPLKPNPMQENRNLTPLPDRSADLQVVEDADGDMRRTLQTGTFGAEQAPKILLSGEKGPVQTV